MIGSLPACLARNVTLFQSSTGVLSVTLLLGMVIVNGLVSTVGSV